MDNFKKYLPSKIFITNVLIIIVIITLFFIGKGAISLLKKDKTAGGKNVQVTVGDVIQKDSNNNGIADWEEYLWGLDPNKNGKENKEYILAKKDALAQKSGDLLGDSDSSTIMENEALSRQFFATIVALQQTGNLNEESLNSISESIGQQISTETIPDIYTEDMLTKKEDSNAASADYFTSFVLLLTKYSNSDIGSELTLISQGIGSNDPQALYAVGTIASAYRSFGQDLMKITVPYSLIPTHISLANNYEKNAQAIEQLTKVLSDQIAGMKALVTYKKYNDALVSDMEKLSMILQ